jgi:hypothetical protein
MIDPRLPRPVHPAYSRAVIGPIKSLSDYREYLIRGELIIPIPKRPIGELVSVPNTNYNWQKDWNEPVMDTSSVLGGPGLIVCEPKLWGYQTQLWGYMFKRADYREHCERQIRQELFKELVNHFQINMRAYEM